MEAGTRWRGKKWRATLLSSTAISDSTQPFLAHRGAHENTKKNKAIPASKILGELFRLNMVLNMGNECTILAIIVFSPHPSLTCLSSGWRLAGNIEGGGPEMEGEKGTRVRRERTRRREMR